MDGDRDALLDFWNVYEHHADEVTAMTLVRTLAHSELGPIVRALDPSDRDARSRRARGLLQRAFVDGEWDAYVAELRAQGLFYAAAGVSLGGFNELVRSFRDAVQPDVVRAYAGSPQRLSRALHAMNQFLDLVIATLTQHSLTRDEDRRDEERLSILIGSIREYAIFMLEPDGRVASWNAGAEAINGFLATEVLGKHFSIFFTEEDRLARRPERELERAERDGRTEEQGWRVRKDESRFWADIILTAVRDPRGTLLGFGEVSRDLTQRKRAEEELRRAKEAAELANRELEAFSYSVAHDLRAPLRAIHGFSRALVDDYGQTLEGEGAEFLHRIRAAAERMACLIDGLLSLSRVTRVGIDLERVDLSSLAASVVAQLRAGEPLRAVEVAVHDGLVAFGDPRLLRSLLENLIGNAWKFSNSEPAATIEVGRLEGIDGGRDATFFVRDNGVGFDMTYAQRLFAPFQRLHTTKEFPGTGIGLATAQRIVHRHGGRIWADAEAARGATFYFTLPMTVMEEHEEGS